MIILNLVIIANFGCTIKYIILQYSKCSLLKFATEIHEFPLVLSK